MNVDLPTVLRRRKVEFVIDDLDRAQFQAFALSTRAQVAIVLIFVGVAASAVMLAAKPRTSEEAHEPEVFSRLLRTTGLAHRLVFLRRQNLAWAPASSTRSPNNSKPGLMW